MSQPIEVAVVIVVVVVFVDVVVIVVVVALLVSTDQMSKIQLSKDILVRGDFCPRKLLQVIS